MGGIALLKIPGKSAENLFLGPHLQQKATHKTSKGKRFQVKIKTQSPSPLHHTIFLQNTSSQQKCLFRLFIRKTASWPQNSNIAMENPPFEDVFPIQDGDFPLLCLFTGGDNDLHNAVGPQKSYWFPVPSNKSHQKHKQLNRLSLQIL